MRGHESRIRSVHSQSQNTNATAAADQVLIDLLAAGKIERESSSDASSSINEYRAIQSESDAAVDWQ